MMRGVVVSVALSCIGCIGCVGCIIPDKDISLEPLDGNPSAVRIVQSTPLLTEMLTICNADPEDENPDPSYCPQVPSGRASGLVRPFVGDLCSCAENERDDHAIEPFVVWAEDGDREGDRPKDTLYGVALLDPDPASDSPSDAVAYRNYWPECAAGTRYDVRNLDAGETLAPSIGRDENDLWAFQLENPGIGDGDGKLDLCSDNEGDALAPGVHTLRVLVTDREFFHEVGTGLNGEPKSTLQCGVPDLAIGATYAVVDYVFECRDPTDPTADCACVEKEP